MGSSQILDINKNAILWLDQNVYNEENKDTYKEFLPKLKNYNFFCFTSVDKLFEYIGNNLNYFEFRHFYVIVSGRLAEIFYNEYLIATKKYNIIADTIVYCFKQKYHETKPYFKDSFLNSGGITSNFENVVKYILKDEFYWDNIKKNYIKYIPEKEGYGDVFMNLDTTKEYELALPILISKLINSSLIKKDEITNFQNLLISRYCKSYSKTTMESIKPSGDRNMNIPLHILTKYFINFYTKEKDYEEGQNFYEDLNKDLTNNKFDDYYVFIFLIYNCLNKKYIQPYKKQLFRGGKLSKTELDKLLSNYNSNKNNNEKTFYYSKNFLSFSKEKNVAYEFMKKSGITPDNNTVNILYILDECKDKDFFVTNIDIESLSDLKIEKEVLILPLSCFEIVKIGDEETYQNIKYRKIYLNYLDKYKEKIGSKINELREKNDKDAINNFFINSINSQFGKSVQKYYNKNNKLSKNYAQLLNATPDNSYFINQIAISLMQNIEKYSLSKKQITASKQSNEMKQTASHIDDEAQNLIEDIKCKNSEDKDTCKIENRNRIIKYFDEKLMELNINIEQINNGYSIGYCLGNFIYNFKSFLKAPNSSKAFSLASLALACGPHIIDLIPNIKHILKTEIIKDSLNIKMMLDGLNILWALGVEFISLFKYCYEYKINSLKFMRYVGKRFINVGIAYGFSIIGNLAVKGLIYGFRVMGGFSLAPFITILGISIGGICGYLGNNLGNYLADKVLGKDEFNLTSANLYYLYIPEKYRKPGNNPHLQWNDSYLPRNVESYIIECIVNEVDTRMRVMNIPKDVFELPECLGGYYISHANQDEDTDCSSYEDGIEEIQTNKIKIIKDKKFLGDLIIPYKGIKGNVDKIEFIIYRIKIKELSVKEWIDFRDNNSKINPIHDCFIYSVY